MLGSLWSLLLPLVQLAVLVFLFNKVIPLDIEAYPAFVFTALLPWTWFASCIGSSGRLFIGNRDLLRSPNFPPIALILTNTLSNFLTFVLGIPILLALLVLSDRELGASLVALPLLFMIQGTLIVGISLMIATVNVFYRDVQHIATVLLSLLFYLTPVFYRSQQAGENYQAIFTLNPLAVLVKSYRAVFFYGSTPPWGALILTTVASAGVCAFAHWVYRQRIADLRDEI